LLLVGREFKEKTRFELATASRKPPEGEGRQQPHHNINQSSENTKGAGNVTQWQRDTILNTRLPGVPEGVDGFPSGHSNLDDGQPSLLENIAGGV
jgi:hypothetical protein